MNRSLLTLEALRAVNRREGGMNVLVTDRTPRADVPNIFQVVLGTGPGNLTTFQNIVPPHLAEADEWASSDEENELLTEEELSEDELPVGTPQLIRQNARIRQGPPAILRGRAARRRRLAMDGHYVAADARNEFRVPDVAAVQRIRDMRQVTVGVALAVAFEVHERRIRERAENERLGFRGDEAETPSRNERGYGGGVKRVKTSKDTPSCRRALKKYHR